MNNRIVQVFTGRSHAPPHCVGCDEGLSNTAVAKQLHITGVSVCKWRERFRVNRLEGLLDEAVASRAMVMDNYGTHKVERVKN